MNGARLFNWVRWHAKQWLFPSSQARWQRRWSNPAYVPSWLTSSRPGELDAVLARGWANPPATVLDVGCGEGTLSLHLAQLGFDVTGIDFSEAAIARARTRVPGTHLLVRFEICDVTQHVPSGSFDVIFDRGCFHALSPRQARRYATTIADACARGAHLILIAPIGLPGNAKGPRKTEAEVRAQVIRALKPAFSIVDEVVYGRPAAGGLLAICLERT